MPIDSVHAASFVVVVVMFLFKQEIVIIFYNRSTTLSSRNIHLPCRPANTQTHKHRHLIYCLSISGQTTLLVSMHLEPAHSLPDATTTSTTTRHTAGETGSILSHLVKTGKTGIIKTSQATCLHLDNKVTGVRCDEAKTENKAYQTWPIWHINLTMNGQAATCLYQSELRQGHARSYGQ